MAKTERQGWCMSIGLALMYLRAGMAIKYFKKEEGIMVQLSFPFAVFTENGIAGLKIMESVAKTLGCQPLEDGVHGKGSYFSMSKYSDCVFAKGILPYTDSNEEVF